MRPTVALNQIAILWVGFAGISSSILSLLSVGVEWSQEQQSRASPYGRVFRKSQHFGTALGARRLS